MAKSSINFEIGLEVSESIANACLKCVELYLNKHSDKMIYQSAYSDGGIHLTLGDESEMEDELELDDEDDRDGNDDEQEVFDEGKLARPNIKYFRSLYGYAYTPRRKRK